MRIKPIVNELEPRFGDRIRIVRVDLHTPAGRELAARYEFSFTPFFVGFDAQGELVWRSSLQPPNGAMLERLLE